LRSKIGIIPQDPVLFTGTLRYNLDPFDLHEDKRLWDVLERVKLGELVRGYDDTLRHPVMDGGGNFSVGERQLICMARALLLDPKVLLLDEATASLDQHTDQLIQDMIRRFFADKTVLTIAHRLETIMDSNRVLVLDEGTIAEFDSPLALLQQKSVFYDMVMADGPETGNKLSDIATMAWKEKTLNGKNMIDTQ
jgi:ATP-binding cassette subfamily C (CFTR/MRP) protein 4